MHTFLQSYECLLPTILCIQFLYDCTNCGEHPLSVVKLCTAITWNCIRTFFVCVFAHLEDQSSQSATKQQDSRDPTHCSRTPQPMLSDRWSLNHLSHRNTKQKHPWGCVCCCSCCFFYLRRPENSILIPLVMAEVCALTNLILINLYELCSMGIVSMFGG